MVVWRYGNIITTSEFIGCPDILGTVDGDIKKVLVSCHINIPGIATVAIITCGKEVGHYAILYG